MRKFGNIVDILGDEHLKVDALNMKCFVLTFVDPDRPPKLIEDLEILASPPLSLLATPLSPAVDTRAPVVQAVASEFNAEIDVSPSSVNDFNIDLNYDLNSLINELM